MRRLAPSEAARQYYDRVRPALAMIAQASAAARAREPNATRLSLPPGFAARWFAPRMARLFAAYPALSLSLNATASLVDFDDDQVDVAVRYFDGRDERLDVTLLARDAARLYCSPAYRRRLRLTRPDDLARAVLLDNTMHPHWARWFAAHSKLSPAAARAIPRIGFDQSALAIDAARRGQGVVLTSALLTEAERASGELIEPFRAVLELSTGYYLVTSAGTPLRPGPSAVCLWLREQFHGASAGA